MQNTHHIPISKTHPCGASPSAHKHATKRPHDTPVIHDTRMPHGIILAKAPPHHHISAQ